MKESYTQKEMPLQSMKLSVDRIVALHIYCCKSIDEPQSAEVTLYNSYDVSRVKIHISNNRKLIF